MIIFTKEFKEAKINHVREILALLLVASEEFRIVCNVKVVDFEPMLDEDFLAQFKDVIVFDIANYSLETAEIVGDKFEFIAAFGEDNFESRVSIPLSGIITVEENEAVVFINVAASFEERPKNPFMLNPRNRRFLEE